MRKTKSTRQSLPWRITLVVLPLLIGLAIGFAIPVAKSPVQCAEIAVTGTKGVSTMALNGDDLYLTGVKAIRCAVYPAPPASHLGF